MAYIKIHAGNFLTGYNDYVRGGFRLRTQAHRFRGEFVPLNEVDTFEVKTEEHVQRVSDAFGIAAIGFSASRASWIVCRAASWWEKERDYFCC